MRFKFLRVCEVYTEIRKQSSRHARGLSETSPSSTNATNALFSSFRSLICFICTTKTAQGKAPRTAFDFRVTPSTSSPVADHARRQHRSGLDDDPGFDVHRRGEARIHVSHGVDDGLVANVHVRADLNRVLVT